MFARIMNKIEDLGREVEVRRKLAWTTAIKGDGSPVTEIDLWLHEELSAVLKNEFQLPIISEEDAAQPPKNLPPSYWLLDPLDGTKHFIQGDGEYAFVMGLVVDREVVAGLVHGPHYQQTYWAERGKGAFKNGMPIHVNENKEELTAFSSGYHERPQGMRFMELLNITQIKKMGSALKMCRIADGEADLYPRFGETYEWDTAGAQIILEEAGGVLLSLEDLKPLKYGKPSLLNKGFLASRRGIDFDPVFKQMRKEGWFS